MRVLVKVAAIALATLTLAGLASLGAVYVAMAVETGNDLGKGVVQTLLVRTAIGMALGWVALVVSVVWVERIGACRLARVATASLLIVVLVAMAMRGARLAWWGYATGLPGAFFLLVASLRPGGAAAGDRGRAWRPGRAMRVGLFLLYGLLLTGLSEGLARMVFRVPALADRMWANESISWQRFWVDRHRDDRQLESVFDTYDATKGWMSRPGLRDEIAFGDKRLSTNSLGLRGKRDCPPEKVAGRPRILILGDSFTFGDEVNDEDVYPHLLQQRLPEAEVLNFGVHGFGHDQMLILLREQGPRLRPDVVVLGYVRPDEERNVLSFRDYAKPMFVLDGAGLRLTNSPVPLPEQILRDDWKRPRLFDLWAVIRQRTAARSGAWQEHIRVVTTRLLDAMVATTQELGARLIVAYLPVGVEIESDQPTATERFLADYCAANPAIGFVSAWPLFAARRAQGVRFKTVGHWRRPGHETVAEALATDLVERGLVSPSSH